ncbi:hypothetical protein VRRI112168_07320 [Vreelandella rituensis]|uniref:Polysaccharide chain length determinant N-terminal domain-containing protein n=1 Tax=Vreelandella rituensis TaxID=2282306 RepID=A0A368UAH2_9GAMM|nr:hypothetical protein [Halomonas rituensis]RCV92183.1 hypothetical protein DU506_09290 [Halomonas rituensis]
MIENSSSSERGRYDEAISLVDMVVAVLRHWKVMSVILILGSALTISVALLMPQKYIFTSLYSIAEYVTPNGETKGLEAPESLMARIRNVYLEAESHRLQETNGLTSLPFEVEGSIPNNSMLIVLHTEASSQYEDWITELHEKVLTRLDKHQHERMQQRRESLTSQLEATVAQLDSVRESGATNADVLITSYQERIAELETLLGQLRDGEVAQVAMQGVKPGGASRLLVIALGLILTLLLAPLGAMLAHFVSLVTVRLQQSR